MMVSGWSGHMDFINPNYVTTLGGKLEKVHKTAANQFLMEDAMWFTVDYNEASLAFKDIKKNYIQYLKRSQNHTKHSKDNFSFDKMVERIGELLGTEVVGSKPMSVGLKLPKLKKVGKQEPPKLKLPKLKKV